VSETGRQLQTDKGPMTLRPERPDDEALLFQLFRSWALDEIARMPVDEATKENLLRFQFAGQTMTYRGNFPTASFDIIERDGAPIGRLIVDPGDAREPACLVDFVLLPETRNNRIGRAIISAVLAEQAALGRKVRVKILHHNEPSQRMCAALGFVEIDRDLPFIQMEWSAPATA
jgi:RimJ/RimL family protein N-acetyltransferase